MADVERNARDGLAKQYNQLLRIYENKTKHIATLEQKKGELTGVNKELKKRKSDVMSALDKMALETWKSQQRLYEHTEKTAVTNRFKAQNRVQDSYHRANEM